MSEIDVLREQLQAKEAELLTLKLELIETKIQDLQRSDADKETRLRAVEASRIRFETLAWLAFGGGAVSLINIFNRLIK
jgi:hypothetical protein